MARSHPASRATLAALLAGAALLALPVTAHSWGSATHHYIAQNYSQHLPATIDGLKVWDATVDAHVTDPDTRRPSTPGEAPRHFIDIDAYPEFVSGAMPHDRFVLEQAHGTAFVEDTGIVPWAIAEVVGTLTAQFQALQWSAAALTIADLCHYVGDATQPLHCTKNFDGQLSGNNGIHSRYESTMMGQHIADLHTSPMGVAFYASPVDAAFGIVSGSWARVGDVLAADNAAKAASGGSFNTTYYNALWSATQAFTRTRVDSATVATASLVYTAWVNAGSPQVPGSTVSVPPGAMIGVTLSAGPSPFRDALTIRWAGAGPLSLAVFDVRGRMVERLDDRIPPTGSRTWRPASDAPPGIYFVRLIGAKGELVRRATLLR